MRNLVSNLAGLRVKVCSRFLGRALKRSDILTHLHRLEENLSAEVNVLTYRSLLIRQIIDDLKSL